MTKLSLGYCCLSAKDTGNDMVWSFSQWLDRRALTQHIRACARGLRGLTALQELELDLEIDLARKELREDHRRFVEQQREEEGGGHRQ
jgi:hypothetical protein